MNLLMHPYCTPKLGQSDLLRGSKSPAETKWAWIGTFKFQASWASQLMGCSFLLRSRVYDADAQRKVFNRHRRTVIGAVVVDRVTAKLTDSIVRGRRVAHVLLDGVQTWAWTWIIWGTNWIHKSLRLRKNKSSKHDT